MDFREDHCRFPNELPIFVLLLVPQDRSRMYQEPGARRAGGWARLVASKGILDANYG